jgi:hypothetical protein
MPTSDRPQIPDPDYFAQRELAVTRAIQLGRDLWNAPDSMSIFDCPTVESPPAELRIVRQAHARARALGLVLPAYPATTVRFVRAPDLPEAAAVRKRDGVIEMAFVAGQPLDGLRRLALHEFAHVDQLATGAWLSTDEREAAAEMFAWNALRGWSLTE